MSTWWDTLHSGTTLVTTIFVIGFFTMAIYVLRMWFRITRRKYDVSDTLLSGAVFCALIQSTIWLILVFAFHYGTLKARIPPPILASPWPQKLLYTNQILFKLTTPLCKLSLCFLYLTICAPSTGALMRRTRLAINTTIALILSIYASAILVSTFQCSPVRKTWSPGTPGHCIALDTFRASTAAFNIATSLAVITLPIPLLATLKHHRPEIKQLIGLVLLGSVHTSLTVARFVLIFFPDRYVGTEQQVAWIPAYTLAVAEMMANVLFASLVVMRPAFQAVGRKLAPKRETRMRARTDVTDSVVRSVLERWRGAWGEGTRASGAEGEVRKTISVRTDETADEERGICTS